jgi:hypothetical protein
MVNLVEVPKKARVGYTRALELVCVASYHSKPMAEMAQKSRLAMLRHGFQSLRAICLAERHGT